MQNKGRFPLKSTILICSFLHKNENLRIKSAPQPVSTYFDNFEMHKVLLQLSAVFSRLKAFNYILTKINTQIRFLFPQKPCQKSKPNFQIFKNRVIHKI